MTGVKHTEIILTDSEQKIADFIAKVRTKTSRAKGIKNLKVGPQSPEQTELEGAGSELAAAKILNVWPDLSSGKSSVEDFTYNGFTVDVKTTKYPNGRLILPLYKKQKACDYYVLMVGTFPKYKCVGVASKNKLIDDKNITSFGWNNHHALEQAELMSIEDFINETKARA